MIKWELFNQLCILICWYYTDHDKNMKDGKHLYMSMYVTHRSAFCMCASMGGLDQE